jgi:hypothetical protein
MFGAVGRQFREVLIADFPAQKKPPTAQKTFGGLDDPSKTPIYNLHRKWTHVKYYLTSVKIIF